MKKLMVLVLAVFLTGCETHRQSSKPMGVLHVSGFSEPNEREFITYCISPSERGVVESDLEFREFARSVEGILVEKGFRRLEIGDPDADFVVALRYSTGKPVIIESDRSRPVYGQTGGGHSTFSGTTVSQAGSTTTTGSVYTMPTFGVVGSRTEKTTFVAHRHIIIVEGYDVQRYRPRDERQWRSIWKTEFMYAGEVPDFRFLFPRMLEAGKAHLAQNTGRRITTKLNVSP